MFVGKVFGPHLLGTRRSRIRPEDGNERGGRMSEDIKVTLGDIVPRGKKKKSVNLKMSSARFHPSVTFTRMKLTEGFLLQLLSNYIMRE